MKLPMLSADGQARRNPPPLLQDHEADDSATISTKALDLLKSMPSEEERERATVYMEGLAQMRRDWSGRSRRRSKEVR